MDRTVKMMCATFIGRFNLRFDFAFDEYDSIYAAKYRLNEQKKWPSKRKAIVIYDYVTKLYDSQIVLSCLRLVSVVSVSH